MKRARRLPFSDIAGAVLGVVCAGWILYLWWAWVHESDARVSAQIHEWQCENAKGYKPSCRPGR